MNSEHTSFNNYQNVSIRIYIFFFVWIDQYILLIISVITMRHSHADMQPIYVLLMSHFDTYVIMLRVDIVMRHDDVIKIACEDRNKPP